MAEKTEVVRLRITPQLKEALRQAAQAENRTISNYIECLILRQIQQKP